MIQRICLWFALALICTTTASAIEFVRQKNQATVVVFPIVDADGDFVTGAASLDSEIDGYSDGVAPSGFVDCTNEAAEIGASGLYYLSLTAPETNNDYILIQIKTSTTGAKTQTLVLRTMLADPLLLATTSSGHTIDVLTTGEVGVDLSNVSGTLDATEIGTDALGSAQLASAAVDEFFEYDTSQVSSAASMGVLLKAIRNSQRDSTLMAIRDGASGKDHFKADLAGSGQFSVTLVAYDSTAGLAIPGARLAVRNLPQTALLATGVTGSNGHLGVNLDAGSYVVVASAPAYLFNAYDTVTIAGAGIDSLAGYPFDPGAPTTPSFCRVFGWVIDFQGQPVEGVNVSVSLPRGAVRASGLTVSPFGIGTNTDFTGYWAIDLIPSESLTPAGTKYEFSITRSDGTILRRRVAVPNSSSWLLTW